ncbi:MAG TPA: metalloregulator ArsR/SmtB family transcription factor [Longimicrobiales bacterium]
MAKIPLTPAVLDKLAERFKALAEPNRLAILSALRGRELTVTALVEETSLGQANVSKHLNLLYRYGFVQRRKEGLNVYYSLADKDVFRICDIMCGRLESEASHMRHVVTGRKS